MQKAIANPKENTYSKNWGKSYRNINKKKAVKKKSNKQKISTIKKLLGKI